MRRKPLAAIGLATTGAVAIETAMPSLQRFIPTLNLSFNNFGIQFTAWQATLNTTFLPALQRILENGYAYLSVTNVWNYLIILTAVILEGPIATILGGIWASMGRVNFWAILLVSMIAGMFADSFWYYLGHFGREHLVERWGKFLKLDIETLNRIEATLFGKDAKRIIFFSKLTSALIIPTLVAAGMTKLGWRRVMRTMLPAQFLWSAGMTAAGYTAADSVLAIVHRFQYAGWIAVAVLVTFYATRIITRWKKSASPAN